MPLYNPHLYLVLNLLIFVKIMNYVLSIKRGYCLTHLLIPVKLMALRHGWINLLYLMYQSLIMLYVLTISIMY